MKNLQRPPIHLLCCIVALCFAAPNVALADDWFTDNPQQQCEKIAHESHCDCADSELTPVTGGQTDIEFFERSKTTPYATYLHAPAGYCPRSDKICMDSAFSIEGKPLSCENFYKSLQAKQKSCHGCLDIKTQLGI